MTTDREIANFLDATADNWPENGIQMLRGTIMGYNSILKLATATLSGGVVVIDNIHHFSHYTPVAGDDVHFFKFGGEVIIFGRVVRP